MEEVKEGFIILLGPATGVGDKFTTSSKGESAEIGDNGAVSLPDPGEKISEEAEELILLGTNTGQKLKSGIVIVGIFSSIIRFPRKSGIVQGVSKNCSHFVFRQFLLFLYV